MASLGPPKWQTGLLKRPPLVAESGDYITRGIVISGRAKPLRALAVLFR